MTPERMKQLAMPRWVKVTIGVAVLLLVVIVALVVAGHGPWQHATAGTHG